MAYLPPIKEIKKEDFPDGLTTQAALDKFIGPLNRFMQSVYSALNRGVTVKENLRSQIKELSFTQNAGVYPLKFAWAGAARPTDVWVTSVISPSGASITDAVFAEWDFDGQSVRIKNLTNLTNGEKYIVRVIALAN